MKKNSLSTAIVAGVAGVSGLAGMANAVNVNPDGLGQVLLYPYYTVNSGNTTLLSVVNTTNQAKAVKVRFLEALNSAEVLDFNLYLSEFDVWTAAISSSANGAVLTTNDNSCTVPNGVGAGAGTEFVPFEFESNNPDVIGLTGEVVLGGAGGTLASTTAAERMRQGHVEIIEMGTLFDEGAPSNFNPEFWTTHTAATGAPANCGALQAAWSTGGRWVAENGRAMNAPSGGLFGGGLIVDVAFGRSVAYNADAIDGFFSAEGLANDPTGSEADLHSPPGDVQPNLTRARTNADDSATANIFVAGEVISPRFDNGIDAVSAVLMARYVFNEFNIEAGLAAASEWVVTFPTKRSHTYGNLAGDVRPFSDNSEAGEPANRQDGEPFDRFGLCEIYQFTRWDREELPSAPITEVPIISPPPPQGGPAPNPSLCWESNVIAFNQNLTATTPSAVLGALPTQGAHGLSGLFNGIENGWARIQFDDPAEAGFQNYLVSQGQEADELAANLALVGLPVIGFWAADYTNGDIADGVSANFSQLHKHRTARGFAVLPAGAVAPAFGTPLDTTGLSGFGAS